MPTSLCLGEMPASSSPFSGAHPRCASPLGSNLHAHLLPALLPSSDPEAKAAFFCWLSPSSSNFLHCANFLILMLTVIFRDWALPSWLGEVTPSYTLHTRAFGTYLLGAGYIYLAKKIISWWYFTCKHVSLFQNPLFYMCIFYKIYLQWIYWTLFLIAHCSTIFASALPEPHDSQYLCIPVEATNTPYHAGLSSLPSEWEPLLQAALTPSSPNYFNFQLTFWFRVAPWPLAP
jgi:hypothetical protein